MKDCNSCGKCCIKYSNDGLSATEEEIELWELFRPEISDYVSGGKIWMDPVSGKQILRCPWLEQVPSQEKYTCSIYYDRPDDCRQYPVTIEQMVTDECEMLESGDLKNTKKAQYVLDIIMIDSRPPVV